MDLFIIYIGFVAFMIGTLAGYAIATRFSLQVIDRVDQWIRDTESNHWISYRMYRELEERHEEVLQEYSEYQGTIKALKEFGIDLKD